MLSAVALRLFKRFLSFQALLRSLHWRVRLELLAGVQHTIGVCRTLACVLKKVSCPG